MLGFGGLVGLPKWREREREDRLLEIGVRVVMIGDNDDADCY
jgi:hypothetical protein